MRFVALLIGLLVATSCVHASDKVLPVDGEQFVVAGHDAFLISPKPTDDDVSTPWVFYAPTMKPYPGPEERWLLEQLRDAGFAIAGIDVGESYGSPDGVRIYNALYDTLVKTRSLSPKPVLLARSRGGLMLLNWAVANPDKVNGFAGILPVCDLRSYPGLAKACGAYGLTEQELAAKLTQYNPIDRLQQLADHDIPFYLHHGDSDELVPLEANSGALAERYQALGGTVTLNIVEGGGHDMWEGWFHHLPMLEFILAYGRNR